MVSTTVEPCPFCGSDDLEVCAPDDVFDHWYVACNRCTSFGPPSASEEDAVKNWNQRTDVERLSTALTVEGELLSATHAHAGAVVAQLEAKEKEVAGLRAALAAVPEYTAEIAEECGRTVIMPFDQWLARRERAAVLIAAAQEYISRPEVAAMLHAKAVENDAAVERWMQGDSHE